MLYMSSSELREKFIKYFESLGHLRIDSASLIPQNDKSLLLINSGMAPLKPYFTGLETAPSNRVVNYQKCLRTEDLENVGRTIRHGTFFEMLGNFSFGDYFKEEIIPWAWNFLTNELGIPEEKLFVSVYLDDQEAYDIWNKKVGLDKSKIFRLGKEDNFWEVGIGPCGPCSEIYFDLGTDPSCTNPSCSVGCDCDRYIEIWNLVFTQLYKEADGTYSELKNKNIDTGMGLERLALVMQGAESIFEIDTTKDLIDDLIQISKNSIGEDSNAKISSRVIADHIKSTVFLIADGVMPSNEGRGYVLRRLIRRALRHARLMGIDDSFLTALSNKVIDNYVSAYPYLLEKKEYIHKIISIEEEKFLETLDRGLALLDDLTNKLLELKKNTVSGKDIFKLYDTFGFPLDLTKEILDERNFLYDEISFHLEMEAQRKRAQSARGENSFLGADLSELDLFSKDIETKFIGYENLEIKEASILGIFCDDRPVESAKSGETVLLMTNITTFYPEGGGQVGDTGFIQSENALLKVENCFKTKSNKIVHLAKVIEGELSKSDVCEMKVDKNRRKSISKNHTATHLLHKSLKTVLGKHVEQSGSLVDGKRLRFDFNHFEALSQDEIRKIEDLVNNAISENLNVTTFETNIANARHLGAVALFGEKYEENVRVVDVDSYSLELCGGTHVSNSSEIGIFKIVSENGIAAGVRRIFAITSLNVIEHLRELIDTMSSLGNIFNAPTSLLKEKVEQFFAEQKSLAKELEALKSNFAKKDSEKILSTARKVNEFSVILSKSDNLPAENLKSLADELRAKLESYVIVFAAVSDEKINFICVLSDDAIEKGLHAGKLVNEIAKMTGGSGGGRANMAQAGGLDSKKIEEAFVFAYELISEKLQ